MQVTEDQKLLREKVQHLSGDAGIERMECALSETRARFFRVGDNESPVRFPMTQSMLPTPTPLPTIGSASERNTLAESNHKTSRVVRSLFKETTTSPGGSSFSAPITSSESQLGSSSEKFVTDNEVLVNEFLHERHRSFSDGLDVDHIQNSIEVSTSLFGNLKLLTDFGRDFCKSRCH